MKRSKVAAAVSAALGLGAVLALPVTAWAQTAPDSSGATAGAPAAGGDAAASQTAQTAAAPAGGGDALQEVVVTAERRSTSLQDTPIVMTAISQDTLLSQHIASVQALQQTTPAFAVNDQTGGMFESINIRGIGNTAITPAITTGVAVFRDGLLQAETIGQDEPLYDIQDVEVLEGPQGTLVGAASTAGAVEINSANPNFRGVNGFVDTTFGNYSEKKVDGAINLPATDTLAFRLAFNEENRNSFYENLSGIQDPGAANPVNNPGSVNDTNLRLSALWKPTDSFQALGKFEYNQMATGGEPAEPDPGVYTSLFSGPCADTGPNGSLVCSGAGVPSHATFYYPSERPFVLDYSGTNTQYTDVNWRYNLELRQTLNDGIVIRSLSGIQHFDLTHVVEEGYSPYNDGTEYHEVGPNDNYYSEELNVISPTTGKVNWIAGAFWFLRNTPVLIDEDVMSPPYTTNPLTAPGSVVDFAEGSVQRMAAVFANVNWQITDTLQLQIGARENWDNDYNYMSPYSGVYLYGQTPPNAAAGTPVGVPCTTGGSKVACLYDGGQFSDSVPTGKVDLSWTPVPGQNFYAFYARGYKSGGANGLYTLDNNPYPVFQPEHVNDYEIGWKGTLLEHHLQTQVGGYFMQYQNMQLPVYDIYNPALGSLVENLAPSTIKGLEVSLQSHVGHFNANLGVDYNDSVLGAVTALNNAALPSGTTFNTARGPAQCGATPTAGCFNYLPYEQDVSGEEMPFAPKLTANVEVDYGIPFGSNTLRPRVTFTHMDAQYASIFETNYYYLGARNLLGADLDFEAGQWLWELYGTNLTDQLYVSGNDGNNVYYGAPRQYGVRFNYQFGGT